jgi:oxazoline/thiazoline synthase
MMDRVLRFKPHLRAEVAGDELVFLLADGHHYLLRGRPYALVAPLLDGVRTVEAILVALAAIAPAPEVYFALRTLEQRGYLVEVRAPLPMAAPAAGFWHALGSDPTVVAPRLEAIELEFVAVGGADVIPVRAAMAEAGLRFAWDDPYDRPPPGPRRETVRVVVTDDYLDPALAEHDRRARAAGQRWLPLRLTGLAPWFGPLFGRADGPCWHCLAHRLRWNRPIETWLARHAGHVAPAPAPPVGLPATMAAGARLAALSLAWWLADGGTGAIDDHLIAFELTELRGVRHRVDRRPQCPRCGDPALHARRAATPIALAAVPKRFTVDGGFRTMTPAETLARCEALVSPITGVLASLGPVPGRDHPARPVWGAVYRVVPPDRNPGFDDFHKLSSGKGKSSVQARASALCEAIERISALYHGDEPLRRATRAALGDDAIAPDRLENFSAAQHDARPLGLHDPKRGVPRRLRDDEALDWTPAWSLTDQRWRHLPAAYCYQHPPVAADREVCGFNPNGHAAGNCVEEAILQGFLELVERDAVAIWWYNRLRQPAVDLDDFDVGGDGFGAGLRAHYRALGYALWVLDLTTDLGVPVFVALAERADGGRWAVGFGCHLDARLGVQRALTELNQIFDPTDGAPAPWDAAALGDPAFLRPDPEQAPRRAADHPSVATVDLGADVRACVELARTRGLEVLVIDQTRPDLVLSAVKVIVPGLRHFWPRLGPGRLYDVPVVLGRLPRPHTEAELNPVPLYL